MDWITDLPAPERRVYCNRTLNLRNVKAVGFDMDYTLIHYHTRIWEQKAYEHARKTLLERGFPVEGLAFDPDFATLGLILDLELGNVVKANRFGFVKRACHGTEMLTFEEQRSTYARELVDLSQPRWVFMNTLFALSEACLFAQMVDLLDAGLLRSSMVPGALDGPLAERPPMSYLDVYRATRSAIDEAHMMGELKEDIMANPEGYVVMDEEIPLALMDLKRAGKKVILITNSGWVYTKAMMEFAFDPYLEGSWRELFDLVIVSARKPDFFGTSAPIFEIVDEEKGHLAPVQGPLVEGRAYLGGNATKVQSFLGCSGEEILYVGDHIFSDVNVSKKMHRWRTALVVRELEADLAAMHEFREKQKTLRNLMRDKEAIEHRYSQVRLAIQRKTAGYGPQVEDSVDALKAKIQSYRAELKTIDSAIVPLAIESNQLSNERWGLLMRAGNDKSHLARQIEKNADIYMTRAANLLHSTPFVYHRSPRGSLPHDAQEQLEIEP